MTKKTKIFIAIVLGIAAIIAAWSFLGGSTPDTDIQTVPTGADGTLSTTATPFAGGAVSTSQGSASANEFSGLLSNINAISIDTSIFQNASYRALRDYPVVLGTDIMGRPNPFAPVGSDSGSVTATVGVQTLAAGKIATTSAELGALVTLPDTTSGTIVFQYGTTDAFGSSTTPVDITKTGTTLATVTGLTPGTKYFVQAVVVRGSGTTVGNVMTFTTTAATLR